MQQRPSGQNIEVPAKPFNIKIAELGNNAFINGDIGYLANQRPGKQGGKKTVQISFCLVVFNASAVKQSAKNYCKDWNIIKIVVYNRILPHAKR
jgi:hypothetical protein